MTTQRVRSGIHTWRIAVAGILLLALLNPINASADTNWALSFDGTSDSVVLHKTIDMVGSNWMDTKSVQLWVMPASGNDCYSPDAASCDSIFGDKPAYWGISIGLIPWGHHGGQDRIWIWNQGYDPVYDTDGQDLIGIPYTPGVWVNITLVHENNVLRAYKNGILAGTTASGETGQAPGPGSTAHIGGIQGAFDRFFEGQVDEVSVWSVALTQTAINQNMYQPLVGNEAGLGAYYRMSDGAGRTLTDDSQYSWTGQLLDVAPPLPPALPGPLWVVIDEFTPPPPPAPPTDLTADAPYAILVNLTWVDQSDNEFGFEIERCTGGGCSDFNLLDTVLDGVEAYADTSVSPETSYCYRVRAINTGGNSAYTNTACDTTPAMMIFLPIVAR